MLCDNPRLHSWKRKTSKTSFSNQAFSYCDHYFVSIHILLQSRALHVLIQLLWYRKLHRNKPTLFESSLQGRKSVFVMMLILNKLINVLLGLLYPILLLHFYWCDISSIIPHMHCWILWTYHQHLDSCSCLDDCKDTNTIQVTLVQLTHTG